MAAVEMALPAPRTETMRHPPLELVVCQVRHEPLPGVADPRNALALQAMLGHGFSKLEPQAGAQINFNAVPGATPSVSPASGWRLLTVDGSWAITLSSDSFAIECSQYTSWSEFKALLDALVEAVLATFEPKLVQRIGVRYLDRIWRSGSTVPSEWTGYLNESVLGMVNNPVLAPHVLVSQTYSELAIGNYRMNVRGSIASDNTPSKYSMVLDTDCFDERSALFVASDVLGVVNDLHMLNLQVFQQVITDQLYEELRG